MMRQQSRRLAGFVRAYVRKTPAPWLWMYKHWRYRPAHSDRPYPFYANFYRLFEDMLEANKAAANDEPKL